MIGRPLPPGAHGGGLTCLDVGSGRYWQATERAEQRVGWLDDGP